MDYDPQYVYHLCDIIFSTADILKRHMDSKHAQDTKQGHTCGECAKSFNCKDNLRRHQLTCQAIHFKCPRCHHILKDIASLTHHMGLCPIPICGTCQEQFVKLDQFREHQKSHWKWKATSEPLTPKLKKWKYEGWFHCHVCLNSFASREELFHHKLNHMDDPRAYPPMEPHFDFKDEKLNAFLHDKSVRWLPISISHSPFPWYAMDGLTKSIRPLTSWLTSVTMKASSSICR